MLGFIGLGWAFDHVQRPATLRAAQRPVEPRGTAAVMTVVAHVVAVTALAGAVEYASRLPFQTVLLIVIPLYALGWALGSRIAARDETPLRSGLALILERGVKQFPNYANEICVFAASGFLGVTLAALIPKEALQAFFIMLTLPPGVIAGLVALSVAVLALLGVNPMISAAILAGTLSAITIPGLSKLVLVLAIAVGWACGGVASPMNSSVVMTAALVGRKPWQVGMSWSGSFAATALALAMVLFWLLVPAR